MFEPGDETWNAVVRHAEERIHELTDLCIDPEAMAEVRQRCCDQIEECRRLLGLPEQLRLERARNQRMADVQAERDARAQTMHGTAGSY